jgi:putative aldouronate transport system substrate-binding protein
MKKIVALLLSIMMLALAAAPALADEPYEVSIQFVGLFEENRNIANVEAALNKITLEKIGCTVDIVPVFIGNLPSTTSLGVAGDEKLDIVVAGLTSPLDTMVKDELLLPLDELLAEYGQDAAKATEHVDAAQRINGVTYAISGYSYAALAAGFVYNKTMAEQ